MMVIIAFSVIRDSEGLGDMGGKGKIPKDSLIFYISPGAFTGSN